MQGIFFCLSIVRTQLFFRKSSKHIDAHRRCSQQLENKLKSTNHSESTYFKRNVPLIFLLRKIESCLDN